MMNNQSFSFGVNIPVKRIHSFLMGIVVINIFFLFGTWLHAEKVIFPNSFLAQWWLVQLNFAKENVLAAWYSSMLLFIVGLTAAICFWADMQRAESKFARILNFGWLGMSGIFLMLSFDEMGSFHEMLSQTSLLKKAGGGNGKLVFFALIGAVALFMAVFFFTKFKANKLALLLTILGLLLLLSNPFQEKFEIESWRNSPDPDSWHRPFIYLLLEEGSEIFAFFCFLFSFTSYAINAAPGTDASGKRTLKLNADAGKNFILWPAALALLLLIAMWLIHQNAWNLKGDDNGIPQDWPPAVMALAGCAGSLYLFFKKGFEKNKMTYAAIAGACLITSAYFGSYMYGYWDGPFKNIPYIITGIDTVAALLAIAKLKDITAKILLVAFIVLLVLSITGKTFVSTVYGYAAVSSLLLALFRHYQSELTRNN